MSASTSQQAAAIAARGNVLVAAGAGTGKTSTVTERCLQLVLQEKCSLEEILMVTFTEAAAAEMRERIRHKLREAADNSTFSLSSPKGGEGRGEEAQLSSDQIPSPQPSPRLGGERETADDAHRLTEQLALLDHAPISTLHSFCLDLVRRNFHALGLDPACVVLDEAQTKPLVHTVLNELFLGHYTNKTTHAIAVRELIRTYGRGSDDVIRHLVVKIHRYTQSLAAPVEWFAAQTVLFEDESPTAWRTMFLQAVREWAQLWQNALAESAEESTNIAASHRAVSLLAANHPAFAQAAEAVASVVAADEAEWKRGTKTKLRKPLEGFFDGAKFLHDLAKNDGAALAEDWNWSREPMLTLLRLAQEFSAAFAQAKRELGGIDFADQEQFALRLLWSAGCQPTDVARACREKYRFVFVDECQDINAAQDAILRAVSREGETANRFLVGDVKQSIYRFRLTDPRIFQRYQEEWSALSDGARLWSQTQPQRAKDARANEVRGIAAAGASHTGALRDKAGQSLSLTENFRSAEGLLRFINPLFRTIMRPVIGGLSYDMGAELQFGNPAGRNELAHDSTKPPRVRLHVITKDEDASGGDTEAGEDEGRVENLDLQSTEREARLVAVQLKALKNSRHQVWCRKLNKFRDVEYSDMVVLLRATSGRTEMFAKAFHHAGVPLLAGRAGFLAAQEVTDVLNLLRLLDNPLQDLPLLAVLRSPFVGLSAGELVQLRVSERSGLLWMALNKFTIYDLRFTNELHGKLAMFLEQYHRWRELIRHSSLTHCVETALIETHYESLLLADERGAERVGNVRRLIEMARRFDPFQREGLFRFLEFISEQEEAEVNHQPAEVANENAVRVMTIHASKGLEFPVVVLAGLGGRFNWRDLSGDILLNEDTGLSPKILPPGTRSRYPSIAHWCATQRERRATLGEELRLLYVAVTRARDTLLLVGTSSKKEEIERWQNPTPITDHALLKANAYLDWLRLWFGNATQSGDWSGANAGANGLLSWQFHAANATDDAADNLDAEKDSFIIASPTAEQFAELKQRIPTTYPHGSAVAEPAKTTVTAIRRRVADETDDEARKLFQPQASSLKPEVRSQKSAKLSAAEVGIAHHAFQQFVTIQRTATELDLRNEAEQMRESGMLSEEQFAALDFVGLAKFWQSEIGIALRKLPATAINREMPFTARLGADDLKTLAVLTPGNAPAMGDFIVVQGQVDLAVLLPEEIWLLDFKTDDVTEESVSTKVKQYMPQLQIYASALERIHRKPVTKRWLHFFSIGETVSL